MNELNVFTWSLSLLAPVGQDENFGCHDDGRNTKETKSLPLRKDLVNMYVR